MARNAASLPRPGPLILTSARCIPFSTIVRIAQDQHIHWNMAWQGGIGIIRSCKGLLYWRKTENKDKLRGLQGTLNELK